MGEAVEYNNIKKVALMSTANKKIIYHEDGNGSGGAQGNWIENNPEENSHILNRPFYSEYEYITTSILNQTTTNFNELENNSNIYHNISTFEEHPWIQLPNQDNQYQLIWDEKIFNHINYNPIYPFIDEKGIIYLGNLNLFNSEWEDNELHFAIALFNKGLYDENNTESYVIECRSTILSTISHTYSINKIDEIIETVHQLDKKYLPISPDWDESNQQSLNFIKNKPFGKYDNLFGPEEITFSSRNNYLQGVFGIQIAEIGGSASDFNIENYIDQNLSISFNNNTYNSIVKEYEIETRSNGRVTYQILGNSSLLSQVTDLDAYDSSLKQLTDTKEPFIIYSTNKINFTWYAFNRNFINSNKLLLTIQFTDIKLLDTKWLPKDELTSDWNEINTDKFNYVRNKPFGYFPYLIKPGNYKVHDKVSPSLSGPWLNGVLEHHIDAGETYVIIYKGTTYTLQAKNYRVYEGYTTNETTILGIGHPKYCHSSEYYYPTGDVYVNDNKFPAGETYPNAPFFITNNAFYCQQVSGQSSFSLQAYKNDYIVKIERKYLPDDVGGVQSDWNEKNTTSLSYIKNKPVKFADWNSTDKNSINYIHNKPSNQDFQADWNEINNSSLNYIKNKPSNQDFQADWNETDNSSLSYIKNKPSFADGNIQSDWNINDIESPAFIKNKPFGTIPPIIKSNTYSFKESTIVPGKYIWNYLQGFGYELERGIAEKIDVIWDDVNYNNLTEKNYYSDLGTVKGIGNPNLAIINGQSFNDTSYSEQEKYPFFIDFENKIVYSNNQNDHKIYVRTQNTIKYIDSDFLQGVLLPKNPGLSYNGYVPMVSNRSWSMQQIPPSDWDDTNCYTSGTYIKNKPFGLKDNLGVLDIIEGTYKYPTFSGAVIGRFKQELSSNKIYSVRYNNQNYSWKAQNITVTDKEYEIFTFTGLCFGNPYLLLDEFIVQDDIIDNNETFCLFITDMNTETEFYDCGGFFIVQDNNFSWDDNHVIQFLNPGILKLDGKYLPLDSMLNKTNYAAEAKAVGAALDDLRSIINEQNKIISQLKSEIYYLNQRLDNLGGENPILPPQISVENEILSIEGNVNQEVLELNYGEINNETLIFNNNLSSSGNVSENELLINGSFDNENQMLISNGIVTNDGVWEV